jgi:hypothetical protein
MATHISAPEDSMNASKPSWHWANHWLTGCCSTHGFWETSLKGRRSDRRIVRIGVADSDTKKFRGRIEDFTLDVRLNFSEAIEGCSEISEEGDFRSRFGWHDFERSHWIHAQLIDVIERKFDFVDNAILLKHLRLNSSSREKR